MREPRRGGGGRREVRRKRREGEQEGAGSRGHAQRPGLGAPGGCSPGRGTHGRGTGEAQKCARWGGGGVQSPRNRERCKGRDRDAG